MPQGTNPKMGIMINGKIPAIWSGREEVCRGCTAKIGWALVHETGKYMPFNLDDICTSHFATCSKAGEFRKDTPRTRRTKGAVG